MKIPKSVGPKKFDLEQAGPFQIIVFFLCEISYVSILAIFIAYFKACIDLPVCKFYSLSLA